jgi:integrase
LAGHIKKRRSDRTGKTTYQVQIPLDGGKRYVKTHQLKRDAERDLVAQQAKLHSGDFIDARTSARPFRELVTTWERTRAAKLAPKTRERYASVTRTHLLPAFGSTPVGKLSRADIKEWFAAFADERKPDGEPRYSPGTVRKVQVVLSSILSEGVELGLIRENPAARLKLAAIPRGDMTVLTAEEVRALAEAVERPADRLAVYVAAYTGLRAGELWALRRRDVDLAGRRLVVGRTLTSESGRLIFRDLTKTDSSRRVVSLPIFLTNMLTTHLEGLAADRDALVFTAPGGGGGKAAGEPSPIRHELFKRRVFAPAVKAVLPGRKLRWHDLRHTCASLLIHNGASVLLVQKRLGHASSTTTLDRYGWLFPSAEAALAVALDATYDAGNAMVIPLAAAV